MKKPVLILTALLTFCLFATKSFAQATPAASGDVNTTLQSSDNVSVAAFLVKVANLNQSLSAAGPFTVFAPNNEAFNKLSSSKLDSLVADPTKLATLLKGHVVAGKFGKEEIQKGLAASKERKIVLKTIDGADLTLSYANGKISLTDSKGNTANVLIYNLQATNGVVNGLGDVLVGK